jgi:hypothetical protein
MRRWSSNRIRDEITLTDAGSLLDELLVTWPEQFVTALG